MAKRLILIVVILVLALAGCGTDTGTASTPPATQAATQAPTSTPTATPTPHVQKWTTVQHFSGTGSKKTQIFTVPNDYRIAWSCAEENIDGYTADANLAITVYGNDNSYVDSLFETCKVGSKVTTGITEEHQGGQIYLDIGGSSPWMIAVQVLK